ncbi:MAG: DUF2490 domain-containing protein [Bacteroidota bacterium]
MNKIYLTKTIRGTLGMVLLLWCIPAQSQNPESPEIAKFKDPLTLTWVNTYGNIRLTDRFFWIAQTHFRFQQTQQTPFAGQIAQLYNRHAISYLYSKYFRASLGGVLRVNFNTDEVEAIERRAVPEWRIWHEYQFAQPLSRLMLYHRIRLEHRWSKGFGEQSEYIFRNRWRYMFRMKIPLNAPKLSSGTFYLAPESELIMQSGKSVVDSPLEDLRLHTSLGYIVNPRLTVASGLMYSMGQELTDGGIYKQKWTLRFHMYFTPDFRKVKNKLPDIHIDE